MQLSLDLKDPKRSPSMYGGIDVAEIPFICRNLAVGFHVPLAGEQIQLFLRKGRVNYSQRDAMECSIPSREERVFPSTDQDEYMQFIYG